MRVVFVMEYLEGGELLQYLEGKLIVLNKRRNLSKKRRPNFL